MDTPFKIRNPDDLFRASAGKVVTKRKRMPVSYTISADETGNDFKRRKAQFVAIAQHKKDAPFACLMTRESNPVLKASSTVSPNARSTPKQPDDTVFKSEVSPARHSDHDASEGSQHESEAETVVLELDNDIARPMKRVMKTEGASDDDDVSRLRFVKKDHIKEHYIFCSWPECGKAFASGDELIFHRREKHHMEPGVPNPPKIFTATPGDTESRKKLQEAPRALIKTYPVEETPWNKEIYPSFGLGLRRKNSLPPVSPPPHKLRDRLPGRFLPNSRSGKSISYAEANQFYQKYQRENPYDTSPVETILGRGGIFCGKTHHRRITSN